MKDNGQKFECYSKRLMGYFTSKGIRYEYSFIHNTTQKRAWVYVMDSKLSIALKQWSNSNPNNGSEDAV